MAFSDFTYPEVLDALSLSEIGAFDLFGNVPAVAAPLGAKEELREGSRLALTINTEKARSEWLIAPVLRAVCARLDWQISVFSGTVFNADPDTGLAGYCDFLIGRGPQLPHITAPVVMIVEAKKEDIIAGLGQCIAGMVGAQRFNARRNNAIDTIYGCVTSGSNWRFLQLHGTTVTTDQIEYTLPELDKLLGIFAFMLGPVPSTAAA